MAYLQTTATSLSDMLDTISAFATGLGWTVERNNTFTSGSNTRRILSLGRAGFDYAHFSSELNNTSKVMLSTMRSIGLTTTLDVGSNPRRSSTGDVNLLTAGPYVNFWLFGESGANPYIHCVVEHQAGRYRHFGIGDLVKAGVWTGGSYYYGTRWDQSGSNPANYEGNAHCRPFSEVIVSSSQYNNGGVRCDDCDAPPNGASGVDDVYCPFSVNTSRRVMCGVMGNDSANGIGYVTNGMGLLDFTFSQYNQRTHLIRLKNFVSAAAGYRRYIGEPPAIRAVNIGPFQAGEEFSIGPDTWKVFPVIRKGFFNGFECSVNYGLAYKKVA